MSDCCEHYLVRAKNTAENQYASLRSAIGTVIQRQSWKVDQVSFITGARSVDKRDFSNNMKFFGVPEASISSISDVRSSPPEQVGYYSEKMLYVPGSTYLVSDHIISLGRCTSRYAVVD
jgi:hypothetical protein